MPEQIHPIAHPRRRVVRGTLRGLGRLLVPLLSRTQITGRRNFPEHGPLLVVGNHIATMEVVLMVVYAPWQMEMLGAGDIAAPPALNAISQLYGFIPVNRGNLDRPALTQALDVLRQGGVLGIFPEGGIWDPGAMEAKRGVAWLSYHSGSPVLPIGFGGLEGALRATLSLQRPRLVMNVGEVLPPVALKPGVPRRHGLQQAATEILDAVDRLIPEAYREQRSEIIDERFELHLTALNAAGVEVPIPSDRAIVHRDALCKVFYRPAILRIFVKDLHFPATPLQRLEQGPSNKELITALDAILYYVQVDNPGFFPYRFGSSWGMAMASGLRELRELAIWAEASGYSLRIRPVRRYRVGGQSTEIVELKPGEAHVW